MFEEPSEASIRQDRQKTFESSTEEAVWWLTRPEMRPSSEIGVAPSRPGCSARIPCGNPANHIAATR